MAYLVARVVNPCREIRTVREAWHGLMLECTAKNVAKGNSEDAKILSLRGVNVNVPSFSPKGLLVFV